LHSTNAMPTPFRPSKNDDARSKDAAGPWRPLLYRWFVEFNPLYLLSAALVLGGCFLLSRGLASADADQGSLSTSLGIALISEVYACCLLGGVALLTRIGQRRPAVMLALLSLLYQWDLTLHTETCAYLSSAGTWAAAGWFAVFAAKIYAFAWALRVRLEKRVVVAALLGGLGLAVGPQLVPDLGGRSSGALLAVWSFALGALYGSSGGIESKVALTPWGHTVLRRTTRVGWLLSGALLSAHVLFWAKDHAIALFALLPVAPLLFARRVRQEGRMWTVVLGTLTLVGLTSPSTFSVTALLAAATLCLRVLSPAFAVERPASRPPEGAPPAGPYRSSDADCQAEPPRSSVVAPVMESAERMRSFVGAFFALYLSAWTLSWSGGPWPVHVAALDAAATVVVILTVWKLRLRSPLVPLAACYANLVLQEHLVRAPRSPLELGATFVAVGFVLLAGSLAASYRLRAHPAGANSDVDGLRPDDPGPSRS
jgi:hypothetical protein